jgi:hypothetical protein
MGGIAAGIDLRPRMPPGRDVVARGVDVQREAHLPRRGGSFNQHRSP